MLFVEHRPGFQEDFIGFDYRAAGAAMAREAVRHRYTNVCLLTGNLCFSNEADFYQGFMENIDGCGCQVSHIQTDSFRSYDEVYEAFNTLDQSSKFDVLRLDVTWLTWFAEKLLMPLSEIDPGIDRGFGDFLEGTPERYARVHGRAFFTRSVNPASPVDYGATITMGSTGVAGSEYLARLFSHQENLYDSSGEIHLDSDTAIGALRELMEVKLYTARDYCSLWTNTAKSFATGNYAMSILYSNYESDLLGYASNVVGKIGYTIAPGANPLIGGGSLGVSRYSEHPEDALSFIK